MQTRDELLVKYQGVAVAVYLREELKPGAKVMATFCNLFPSLDAAMTALRRQSGIIELIRAGGIRLSDDELALLEIEQAA